MKPPCILLPDHIYNLNREESKRKRKPRKALALAWTGSKAQHDLCIQGLAVLEGRGTWEVGRGHVRGLM